MLLSRLIIEVIYIILMHIYLLIMYLRSLKMVICGCMFRLHITEMMKM